MPAKILKYFLTAKKDVQNNISISTKNYVCNAIRNRLHCILKAILHSGNEAKGKKGIYSGCLPNGIFAAGPIHCFGTKFDRRLFWNVLFQLRGTKIKSKLLENILMPQSLSFGRAWREHRAACTNAIQMTAQFRSVIRNVAPSNWNSGPNAYVSASLRKWRTITVAQCSQSARNRLHITLSTRVHLHTRRPCTPIHRKIPFQPHKAPFFSSLFAREKTQMENISKNKLSTSKDFSSIINAKKIEVVPESFRRLFLRSSSRRLIFRCQICSGRAKPSRREKK